MARMGTVLSHLPESKNAPAAAALTPRTLPPPKPGVSGSVQERRTATFEVLTKLAELQTGWADNRAGLGRDDETAVNRIDDAMGKLREAALVTLLSLR